VIYRISALAVHEMTPQIPDEGSSGGLLDNDISWKRHEISIIHEIAWSSKPPDKCP